MFDHTEYSPRQLHTFGVWNADSFVFKAYGISVNKSEISDELIFDAKRFVTETSSELLVDQKVDRQAGFAIVHPGTEGVSICVAWWVQGCVLCQRVLRRQWGDVDPIVSVRTDVVACVWELAIVEHERRSWLHSMMGKQPDLDAYLADILNSQSV